MRYSSTRVLTYALLAFLTTPALAQKTWIVDVFKRSGFTHTDIPAAVTAASAGDVIRVRSASGNMYTLPTLSKGVTLIGERRVPVKGTLRLSALPRGQHFAMKSFTHNGSAPVALISAVNCKGTVHLEDLDLDKKASSAPTIEILDCERVTMHFVRAIGGPAIRSKRSNISFSVGDATGGVSFPQNVRSPAWEDERSRIVIANSKIIGVSGEQQFRTCLLLANAREGMACTASTLILTGTRLEIRGGTTQIQGCRAVPGPAGIIAKSAATRVIRDGNVKVQVLRASVTVRHVPVLFAATDLQSQFLQLQIMGLPGATAITFTSLPGGPISFGDAGLWLDLSTLLVLDVAVLNNIAVRNLKFPLSQAFPLGIPLMFQAALIKSGNLVLSTPDLVLVR